MAAGNGNPCHLPPGREWAIMNLLPVIPRPIFDRYLATGQFPQGIQRGLDASRSCPWAPQMAQYVTRMVVVDGQVITLPVGILGLLPDGWYRAAVPGGPQPVPQDPVVVVQEYARIGGIERPTGTRTGLESPSSATIPVPVPDIDLAIPIPYHPMPNCLWDAQQGRYLSALPGDFGIIIWRLPGSSHPLYGTGLGITFRVRELLTDFGRRYVDRYPASQRDSYGSHLNCAWSRDVPPGSMLSPYWQTRHFAASHMQRVRARVAAYRWTPGGGVPAPFVGNESPRFEVQPAPGGAWYYQELMLRRAAVDGLGRSLVELAPEWPLGPGQFHGPAPGAFLVP